MFLLSFPFSVEFSGLMMLSSGHIIVQKRTFLCIIYFNLGESTKIVNCSKIPLLITLHLPFFLLCECIDLHVQEVNGIYCAVGLKNPARFKLMLKNDHTLLLSCYLIVYIECKWSYTSLGSSIFAYFHSLEITKEIVCKMFSDFILHALKLWCLLKLQPCMPGK